MRGLWRAASSLRQQPVDEFATRRRGVLAHQPRAVDVDRARADGQPLADQLARQAVDQQRGDLALARRQLDAQLAPRRQVLEGPDAGGVRLRRIERAAGDMAPEQLAAPRAAERASSRARRHTSRCASRLATMRAPVRSNSSCVGYSSSKLWPTSCSRVGAEHGQQLRGCSRPSGGGATAPCRSAPGRRRCGSPGRHGARSRQGRWGGLINST